MTGWWEISISWSSSQYSIPQMIWRKFRGQQSEEFGAWIGRSWRQSTWTIQQQGGQAKRISWLKEDWRSVLRGRWRSQEKCGHAYRKPSCGLQKLIPGLLDDSREIPGALISNNSIFWTSYQDILLLIRAYSVASTFVLGVINSLGLLNNHINQLLFLSLMDI